MKVKKFASLLMAAVMFLSLAVCGVQPALAASAPESTPVPTIEHKSTVSAAEGNAQLLLIFDALSDLRQDDSNGVWQYVVTDLDHNGRLELIAAKSHPEDRTTNMKLWEVNETGTALEEDAVKIDEEETFPEIMTENADTYYDTATDTWSYLFYDYILVAGGSITVKVSVTLKDGEIRYTPYAWEVVENNVVTHIDANGQTISDADYNAAGANAFVNCMKGSTNFDWFTIEEASSVSRLSDSYMMFTGERQPATAQTTPVPTAAPAPTATPQPTPTYLMITKNPTNESRKVGDTALFVACANAFTGLSWTMVSPYGVEYTPAQFNQQFGYGSVTGEYSTTLAITNVTADLNGWAAYCTFSYNGQTARTNTAYVYVAAAPQPSSHTEGARLIDWSDSSITVALERGGSTWFSRSLCDISGELAYNCPVELYYTGNEVTYIRVYGNEPEPQPSSHTEGAVLIDWSYSTITVGLNGGGTAWFDRSLCEISGELAYNCPVELYYTGDEVTYIRVYGNEPEPDPVVYSSMPGKAHEGGGGYAIDLENGSQVFIDAWNCNVNGVFVDGSPCTVYFTGYTPDEDSIYKVDIYGVMDTAAYEGNDSDLAQAVIETILSDTAE